MSPNEFYALLVEKSGNLKPTKVSEADIPDNLYKKCGFKKPDDFECEAEWKVKLDGRKYVITLFARADGKANTENKYDFPPPADTTLFFGSCILVASVADKFTNLDKELWSRIYEKLFGGFEDLTQTAEEDDAEEDELDAVPDIKKTKNGYLKDGFVVDSGSDTEEVDDDDASDNNDSEDDDDDEDDDFDECAAAENIGSELSEEEYETEDDDDDDDDETDNDSQNSVV
jgi:hypothetical protein